MFYLLYIDFFLLGAMYTILGVLFRPNACLIFPSYGLNPLEALEVCAKYKCNILIGLPKVIGFILDENKHGKFDLDSLFVVGIGGQHVSGEMLQRIKDELNVLAVGIGLGSTGKALYLLHITRFILYFYRLWTDYYSIECTTITSYVVLMSKFSRETYSSNVGQPYPFVECKIVNPENGQIQPLNVEGELYVRSTSVSRVILTKINTIKKTY